MEKTEEWEEEEVEEEERREERSLKNQEPSAEALKMTGKQINLDSGRANHFSSPTNLSSAIEMVIHFLLLPR